MIRRLALLLVLAILPACVDTSPDTFCQANAEICDTRVDAINPSVGPTSGNSPVVITGQAFEEGTRFYIGDKELIGVVIDSRTQATARTPPVPAVGSFPLRAVNLNGDEVYSTQFTYVQPTTLSTSGPRSGLKGGGTRITATGTNIYPGTRLLVGTAEATNVQIVGGTTISGDAPPSATVGDAPVKLSGPGGTPSLTNAFQYVAFERTPFQAADEGSDFNRMVRAGTTFPVIYVWSDTELYRSLDDGDTWSLVALPPELSNRLLRLAADPADGRVACVAGGGGQVFRTADAGVTWERSQLPDPVVYATAIAVSPINGVVFVSAYEGFYRSTDQGRTFVRASTFVPAFSFETLDAHPADPNVLVGLGYANMPVYRYSRDAGNTWQSVDFTETLDFVSAGPQAGEVLFGLGSMRVERSFDFGVTRAEFSPAPPQNSYQAFRAIQTGGGRYYLISWSTLFELDLSQTTPAWTPIGAPPAKELAVDGAQNLVVAGNTGFYRRDFGGWKASMKGMNSPFILAVTQDPSTTPPTLYSISTNGGVYRSLDRARSWQKHSTLPNCGNGSDIAFARGTLYAACSGAAHQFTGGVWTDSPMNDPTGTFTYTPAYRLYGDPAVPSQLFASGYSSLLSTLGTDGYWEPGGPGLPAVTSGAEFHGGTFAPTTGEAFTMERTDGDLAQVWRRNGTPGTWAPFGPPLAVPGGSTDDFIWTPDGLVLSVGTIPAIFRLPFATMQWARVTTPNVPPWVTRWFTDPSNRRRLYGTIGQLAISDDGGATWRGINIEMSGYLQGGIVDAQDPSHLYLAGSGAGVIHSNSRGE